MKRTGVSAAVAALTALPMTAVVLLTAGGSAAASCVSTPPQQTTGGMNQQIITTAYTEAVRHGADDRVMQALFEAGLDESSFRNLANPNVPASLAIANDGQGADHNSVGYLQQQVGADGSDTFGWGDVAQAMDPLHATDAFLDAAVPLDASTGGDAADLAQAVQQSATPDASNYRAFTTQATQLIAAQQNAAGDPTPTAPSTGPSTAPPTAPGDPTPVAAPTRPVGVLSPATGAYVGTYSSANGLTSTQAIEDYFTQREALAGRKFAIQNFMPGWDQPLASDLVRWDLARGTIPLISWNTPNGISDTSIADGSQDAWIRTEAAGVKALGRPVFLRLDWEMNGNWFAWDGTHNGGRGTGPAAYVAMWRHVHDVFAAEGATNVAWVWTPAAQSLPNAGWNAMSAYYPGDAYVDWAGEDDYNYGGTLGHALGWNAFTSQLQPLYNEFATRKPIMIGEMGSVDGIAGHSKGAWISQLANDVKTHYPDIQALVWFDVKYDADWRFDTSASSLTAFRTWVADPYYNPTAQAVGPGTPVDVNPAGTTCDGGEGTVATGTTTTTTPNGLAVTGTAAGVKAVQFALAQLGKPYVWGAAGPDSYDCSGLTMAAWATAGVTLPHFTGDQVNDGTPEPVDLTQAQAGDLVFIPGSDGTPSDPRHVGMVAGTVTDATGTHLYLLEAPQTGENVELIDATRWAGIVSDVRHIA